MKNEVKAAAEENLSEVLRVRREKLDALMSAGENPFEVTKFDRDHLASEVVEQFAELEGKSVTVAGRMKIGRAHV